MRTLPNLEYEHDILRELASQYDADLPLAGKRSHVTEFCRLADNLGRARATLAYPSCIGRAPGVLIDTVRIRLDLVRVLIRELLDMDPAAPTCDALFATLADELERLGRIESGPAGLWRAAVDGGLDARSLDTEIGASLRGLDAASRVGDWSPADPEGFETLR